MRRRNLDERGGKVIGVDTDQTAQINAYGEEMCVTSAMKGLGATVKSVLGAVKDGNWSAYSGKVESLGLVSVSDIFEKKIEISDAIADVPAHSITLNQYPNIK